MITMETRITGEQIGSALAGDAAELAYCLTALSEELDLADILTVDYFVGVMERVRDPAVVGLFLRALADAIDPPEQG